MPRNFGAEVKGEEEGVVVHAPGNDQVFYWTKGARVEGKGREKMLLRILKGEAENEQVFWGEEEHDEL
jgi:protein disulfide-isomerase A1